METEFVSHAKIIIAGRTEKTSFQVLNGEECVCVCARMHAHALFPGSSRSTCLYLAIHVRATTTCRIPTPVSCRECIQTMLWDINFCRRLWGRKKPDQDSFQPDFSLLREQSPQNESRHIQLSVGSQGPPPRYPWSKLSLCS